MTIPIQSSSLVSAPTDLTTKYLHYLDEFSHLKENTAHLQERSRKLSFSRHLWEEELFHEQSIELQKAFKKSMDKLQENTQQLNTLPTHTIVQIYYQQKFRETLEEMQDQLNKHNDTLLAFKTKITSLREVPDFKSTPSSQKKSFVESPKELSPPPLVHQNALWEIYPLLTSTNSTGSTSPPPLSRQVTDLVSVIGETPTLESSPSASDVTHSLKRHHTDAIFLQDPVLLEQPLRQGSPTKTTVSSSPPPSLPKRLWTATHKFSSFPKREGWSPFH